MTECALDRLHATKPASGISFATAYCHETISQKIRVFTFEFEVGVDDIAEVLEAVAEGDGYTILGLS
jgi:hypothetical protein